MIDRAAEPSLRHPLSRQHRRFNRALLTRQALRAAAGCAVAVAVATLIGVAIATGVSGAWVRLIALTAVAAVMTVLAVRAYLSQHLGLDRYLEHVERHFPALRSWIRNAVDFETGPRPHVSQDLAAALRVEAARRLTDAPLSVLTPRIEARRPAVMMAGGIAVVLLLAVMWPAATARSWNTLWNPAAAAPPVRLVVEPGSVTVTPGSSLAVRARVWGTSQAPRLDREGASTRRPAVAAVAEGGDEEGGRVWRFDLAQLTQAEDYWVEVGSERSPRYRIGLAGQLAPVSFEIEYRAPSYARLPVQRGTAARGDLTALRGTVADLIVTFDRDLEQLQARGLDGRTGSWTALTPRRWKGRVPMNGDGEYELVARARPRADDPTREGRFRYRVTALADAPPVLVVQVPQSDLDLPAGQQVPVDILAQDDLGLTELLLESRKDPAAPWQSRRLAHFDAEPREARVETRWDASSLGLLPGETATFRFVLYDDNAVLGRGQTVSPTFELRFPSLADLYESVDDRQAGAQKRLEKVAEETRELQKSLDKLARQQPRVEQAPSTSFERSEELRSTLERQNQVSRQIQEAAEELRQSLDHAAERNAFDQDLMEKLKQMTELMQQIESAEFKDALRKMQQALENLDKRALERNLPQWRNQNQQLAKNLERTIELLKKLREEEQLQALAQKTRELKAQQDALNKEHADSRSDQPKTEDLAQRQEKAGEKSQDLGKEAAEMAEKSDNASRQEQMNQASESLSKDAAQAQMQASESAQQQQSEAAQKSGQKASEALSKAADLLGQAVSSMQQEQQQLDLAAVRRAAQDLVALQRAGQNNLQSTQPAPDKADRLTDLSEGTSRVADSLYQLSRQTPFISPRLAEALGRAISGLQSSGKELAGGDRGRGEEAGQRALQSLNQAVLELRATESSMCNNPGNSASGGRNSPQQIGDLGKRQSDLNRETRSLSERLSEQMRLSSGDRDEMRRMAEEQARIREQLEEIQRADESKRELLGRLDQAQEEMTEVEEVLREGAMDGQLEEKQQRILSRLLDAQRSVNRRDFDPQRESRVGEEVARRSPADIPADLLRQSDRFRQDLLKSELDRYPAQYRAFVEAYLRSLNGSRR